MIDIILSIIAVIAGCITFVMTSSSGWAGGNNYASGRRKEKP